MLVILSVVFLSCAFKLLGSFLIQLCNVMGMTNGVERGWECEVWGCGVKLTVSIKHVTQ